MREILIALFKTGGGSSVVMLLGVAATKILAIMLGPSGVGLLSILRQTRNTVQSITTFNGRTALVQGLASRDTEQKQNYIVTTFIIIFAVTVLATIAMFFFAPQIANNLLSQSDGKSIALVRYLSIPIFLGTILVYLQSLLNGYRAIGRLAIIEILVAAATLALIFPVITFVKQGHDIAFIGMMTLSTALGIGFSVYFLRREGWLPNISNALISKIAIKQDATYFMSFALTTGVTGLASTWTILLVRGFIVSSNGLDSAGIFDAAWTLSMTYVTLILSSFSTYYLPTLSQLLDEAKKQVLIQNVLHLTLILIVPLITLVIILKPVVINLLYSSEFLDALVVIRWMLIGDYLKSTSWVFGITITAFADKKSLFLSEIIGQVFFLSASAISLLYFNSLEGVGISFAALYFFHLIYTFIYARIRHNFRLTKRIAIIWISGFFILISASFSTWNIQAFSWWSACFWSVVVLLFVFFSTSVEERRKIFAFILNRKKLLEE